MTDYKCEFSCEFHGPHMTSTCGDCTAEQRNTAQTFDLSKVSWMDIETKPDNVLDTELIGCTQLIGDFKLQVNELKRQLELKKRRLLDHEIYRDVVETELASRGQDIGKRIVEVPEAELRPTRDLEEIRWRNG